MNKAELRQKLEAVRDKLAEKYAYDIINDSDRDLSRHCYKAAYDALLCPLLLDAYEALGKSQKIIINDESYEIPQIKKALARIEAFATQGAHEQSEFENGEK